MSRYAQPLFYLTALLLLILLALSFADNGLDGEGVSLPSLDGGVGGLDDGSVGSVGSVDDGSVSSVDTIVDVELLNSSFEQGTESPLNWTPLTIPPYQYLWDSDVAAVGRRSLSIHSTDYFYGRWESDVIAVEPSGFSWYTLTGLVKTASNTGEVYLAIAWFDKDGVLLTTSDSNMLPLGDNDWQSVTVNALPPAGTKTVSVWCISNHNEGYAWFDNIALQLTQLPAQGKAEYARFLEQYPAHRFVLDALYMQVRSLMTDAKWIRESGYYDPQAQLRASKLYAEAARIAFNDNALQSAVTVTGGDFSEEKQDFESLKDTALFMAAITARRGNDTDSAVAYLSTVVARNQDQAVTESAEAFIGALKADDLVND